MLLKKKLLIGGISVFVPSVAVWALVTITAQPTSLITSPMVAPANSEPIGLFKLGIGADAAETLTSIAVTVMNSGSSTATGADFVNLRVYRDDGDNVFDLSGDLLAGSQSTVNVGSATTIETGSNNSLPATFFVALATSGTWSDSAPADSVTVSLATNAVVTTGTSPSVDAAVTSTITADTTGPALTSVVAQDTGGNNVKEAGDSIVFTFNEATNSPTLTDAEINTTFALSSGHTFLDGLGNVSSHSWNGSGTQLTVVISGSVTLPTVDVGDTVTLAGSLIKDAVGNIATGAQTITGTFASDTTGPTLTSAVAADTGADVGLNACDTIVLVFNEATNKAIINAANVNAVLVLNNSHSWLDGAGALGGAAWNDAGTHLTVTLSEATSKPTVTTGDTVTVAGSVIKDAAGNNATGSRIIIGSFTKVGDDDDNDDDDKYGIYCRNGLQNGKLYRQEGSDTVYLAASCKLKVFNGAAVGKAKGKKFMNILNWHGDDDDEDDDD